jgi:predicted nucleotidyltransferase component of viral defense system
VERGLIVSGVKVSFYANPNYSPLDSDPIIFQNNIRIANTTSIGAMKMEVMLRRARFRDYYDIYSLLEYGENINVMIKMALKYSGHKLKSKNLLSMLSRGDRFLQDSNFATLQPIYDVTATDIEMRIRQELLDSSN